MRSRVPEAITTAILLVTTVVGLAGCTTRRAPDRRGDLARPEVMWALIPPSEAPPMPVYAAGTALPEAVATPVVPGRVVRKAPTLAMDHRRVDAYVQRVMLRGHRSFQRALDRSARYVPLMKAILAEEGVPRELAYVPLVESRYRDRAVSPAGAAGQWQFMRRTAGHYGLRVSRYVDERRDSVRATRAAARYLHDLYARFGNWELALAAYNAGEMRVDRVRRRRGVGTFWKMAERGYLHRETCEYVPMVLAAARIARNPEKYGFVRPAESPLTFDVVTVKGSLSLRRAARFARASYAALRALNPALVRNVTPPGEGAYELRLPSGSRRRFQVAYARSQRRAQFARVARINGGRVADRVKKGDTPTSIARRLGVAVRALMRANGWADPRRLRPGDPVRLPRSRERRTRTRERASKETLALVE